MTSSRPLTVAALLALAWAGCVFAPIDASSRSCPCASGYVCVADRCVEGSRDASASVDAAPSDAGARDAAATDAALPDAGPRDAGPALDAGPAITECTGEGRLGGTAFCDGFEDPGLRGWATQVGFGSAGAVRAEGGVEPYRGVRMMRARISRAGSWAELFTCPFTATGACPASAAVAMPDEVIDAGDVYMRAYLYVPSGPTLGDVSMMHLGIHRGFDPVEPPASFNLLGMDTQIYVGAGPAHYPMAPTPRTAMPRDQWVCLQAHFVVSDTAGEVHAALDGISVADAIGVDTLPAVPYMRFGLGIAWTQAMQEVFTLYFDEVGIGRTPIDCDP